VPEYTTRRRSPSEVLGARISARGVLALPSIPDPLTLFRSPTSGPIPILTSFRPWRPPTAQKHRSEHLSDVSAKRVSCECNTQAVTHLHPPYIHVHASSHHASSLVVLQHGRLCTSKETCTLSSSIRSSLPPVPHPMSLVQLHTSSASSSDFLPSRATSPCLRHVSDDHAQHNANHSSTMRRWTAASAPPVRGGAGC
jgi:hypothetical protein